MAKYQKYAEYKDSGVKWLGFVPSHWAIAGFKKYLESTVDYRGKTPEKVEEGIFLVTARNIKNGVVNYSLSQEYVALKDYDEIMSRGKPLLGDVLFTTEAPLGEVAQIDKEEIALAQRIIKFRGKKNILDNTYLKYFILSQQFQDSLMTFATGSTALGIKAERLGYLLQCIPPINEQLKISNFLDHETAQIDTLIAKQEKLIELLKEKRQAVISHAVTKGLNSNVPMKDSGVEWLGEVPEHWISARLKYYTNQIVDGAHFTPTYSESGVPFLRVTDIHNEEIDMEDIKYIPENEHRDLVQRCKPEKGDLLLSKNGTIGVPKLINWDWEFSIFVSLCLIKFKKNLKAEFAEYFFKSYEIQEQIFGLIKKSTVINLHLDKIQNFWFSIPPIEEQLAIVNYLDDKIQELNKLIEKAELAIKFMQERRTALISAAVTGKIDVRSWQHPNQKNNNNTELSA